jgi:hypothetical protein
MTGILQHAPLDMRIAWVRDLFAQIDVDSREGKAVAAWKAATDQGVNRSDSASGWLRRAGASRLLQTRHEVTTELLLLRPRRSRAWLKLAQLECQGCRLVVERRSPAQRYCHDCAEALARLRSRERMARRRDHRA